MNTKLYKQQWLVPSKTRSDKSYKVSLKHDGTYVCSCPHNIFRKVECEHIKEVKAGVYSLVLSRPELPYEFANVQHVKFDAKRGVVQVPLVPLGDVHFSATIVYDLLELGYSITSELVKKYGFKPSQRQDVINYVEAEGRKIYGKWVKGKGYKGYQVIAL